MLPGLQSRLVRFGVFELDLETGDLSKDGRLITLQNQPRQVLGILVSRRGELWPDETFVDFDNGLNVAVRKIRDALGDVAPSSRFIETERARGALEAIAEFQRAVELDPAYARAHGAIASTAAQMRVRFASRDGGGEWDAQARTAAWRARTTRATAGS
jgi:hypothetical protein